jgi:adenine-specific DNA-methyltransferase
MCAKQLKGRPVPKTTPNLFAERVEELKCVFPEVITEGRVDFDKIKVALSEEINDKPERYTFTWAGKKDAIRVLQIPSRATLAPKDDESIDFGNTQNIFIEGDNLEVLKLLWKSYFGEIGLIYIDPPYNIGADAIYQDDYSDPLGNYLVLTGQKDTTGNLLVSNPETSGRFHSLWLSMMYPRLFLARQLLKDDGVIFVSIDDVEVSNLRLIMNEIFGEENFIGQFTVQSNPRGAQASKHLADVHEYILLYARNAQVLSIRGYLKSESIQSEYIYTYEDGRKGRLLGLRQRGGAWRREDRPNMYFPIYVDPDTCKVSLERNEKYRIAVLPRRPSGHDGRWTWGRKKVERDIHLLVGKQVNRIGQEDFWDIFRVDFLEDSKGEIKTSKVKTIWTDKEINYQNGRAEIKELFDGIDIFDFPKPVYLIKKVLGMFYKQNLTVLDFFAGSCTTAHAVLNLNREDGGNRRFIMVQLPESTPENSIARTAGYNTIAEIGKERIRRVIGKMREEREHNTEPAERESHEDLGIKVFKLGESNYKSWSGVEDKDPEAYARQMELHLDPLVEGWREKDVLYEVALKEGYSLTSLVKNVEGVSENNIWKITDEDKEQSFYICLDNDIEENALKTLELKADHIFICRDKALTDELAANLALQCNLKVI